MTQNSHRDYTYGGKQPSWYGKETVVYMRENSHYHWHSCAAQSEIRVEVETRPPVEPEILVGVDTRPHQLSLRSLLGSIHDHTSWDPRWGRHTTTSGPHVVCGLEYSAMVGAIFTTVYGWGRHTSTPVVHVVCGSVVSHNDEGNTYCNICWGRHPTTPDPHVVCRLEHRTTVRAIHIAVGGQCVANVSRNVELNQLWECLLDKSQCLLE